MFLIHGTSNAQPPHAPVEAAEAYLTVALSVQIVAPLQHLEAHFSCVIAARKIEGSSRSVYPFFFETLVLQSLVSNIAAVESPFMVPSSSQFGLFAAAAWGLSVFRFLWGFLFRRVRLQPLTLFRLSFLYVDSQYARSLLARRSRESYRQMGQYACLSKPCV